MNTPEWPQLPDTQRHRRGYPFYPSARDALPPPYATGEVPTSEKLMVVHYVVGACDWWICEYDPETGTAFGYACLGDPINAEWGYIALTALEQIQLGPDRGLIVQRDLSWQPTPFRHIRHSCGG